MLVPPIAAARRRLCFALTLAVLLLAGAGNVVAQGDPRSNVNIIGMTPDPADIPDTYYRQQNEPACAVRPGDSACMICAYNDYRGVELFGDSWQGVSQSCDAGDTWRSRLAPGHALHAAPLPAKFAADPRLAAIPGMAIFNFIAGYRDSNVGVLAIQHWLEVNKEDADHYEPGLETYIADSGTEGRFLDKPDMVAVLDAPNRQGTVTLSTAMENEELGVITRDFPSGTLYVAYAVFTGSSSVKVMLKTSNDWGRTWSNQATKLSEDQNQVSGISLTAIDDKVLAVWRRKGDGNDVDSIMYSMISNGGRKATKGEVLADLCAFDQPTLTGVETNPALVTFRTNDFPWTANDGNDFYAFYSDRGRNPDGSCNTNGQPRIVMHHSADGLNWINDGPIDPNPKTESGADAPNSFQFMPTAFGADGRVQVAWYDTRREECASSFPYVADFNGVCGVTSTLVQRTVDVYTTTVKAGTQTPPPVRASQFSIVVDRDTDTKYETEASYANKKLFGQGTAPFLGDYIAIAAREYRQIESGKWISNATANDLRDEDFFVAWTDNRDVTGVINAISDPMPFTYPPAAAQTVADTRAEPENGPPRDTSLTAEGIEGDDPGAMVCTPGQPATYERSRDANIYGSLIKDQLRLYAPTPSKPLSGLQRAFVVALSNADIVDHTYNLNIEPGSCTAGVCTASFRQLPAVPHNNPLYSEAVTVPAKSTLARTIFVSGTLTGTIRVEARENGALVSTIQLGNAAQMNDPENCPDLGNGQADPNCAVATNELHNLELQTINAGWLNANLLNANLLNSPLVDWAETNGYCAAPASVGCVIDSAAQHLDPDEYDVDPEQTNAALLNAALLNANLLNASLLNADLLNAALLNANLLNMPLDDISAPALDPVLVQAALDGGADATVGGVILFAADPGNNINAALLNAALLNANLLNANLLNADLLNANLLNAALLNAALLNANLLNPGVEAAALLNTNLLNADLLNANLLNPTLVALATEGGCCDHEAEPTIGSVIIFAADPGNNINAALLNAALLNANLLNANLLNANLLNANLLNANLLNANLLNTDLANANLLNANLLNANLLNANLLNADLLNANLLNANLLNANLLNAAIADNETITYDDYTYPITNNGNVTTAIDADISINAPMVVDEEGNHVQDILGAKLITWTVNATPTVIDCVERVQLDARVQSIVATDASFDVATINEPFNGQVSAIAAPGETMFVTLRVVGTAEQLKNVRISGFTASSQAANCTLQDGCDDQLNEGIEQIVFTDTTPPSLNLPGPIVAEATSAFGAVVPYTVTATDNSDANPSLACFPESGDIFPLGVTTVECSAWDSVNNGVSGSFTVTVVDTTAPQLPAYENLTVQATSTAGTPVTWSEVASDLVDGDVAVSCTPASGFAFPIGQTTVNCSASDAVSNLASSSFSVTVEDTTVPVISPVQPPLGFYPGAPYPFELAADANTIFVTWPVSVTDADPGLSISCSIGGVALAANGPPTLNGSLVTATFSYDFPLGDTSVSCIASDSANGASAPMEFIVSVIDRVAPVISVPASPYVVTAATAPVTVDFAQLVSVVDAGDPAIEAECTPASGSAFNWGDTSVSCTAVDASGNAAAAKSFTVRVRYLYDVRLVLPKGATKAGSTIPLDWQYLDWTTGLPVPSNTVPVSVRYVATVNCSTATPGGLAGEDSGSSNFRYSSSSMTWQYSWQTPGTKGKYLVTVVPPGNGPNATACVTLN